MMIIWVVYGYCWRSRRLGERLYRRLQQAVPRAASRRLDGGDLLDGVDPGAASSSLPDDLRRITPALIVGGFAERMKFSAVVLFVLLWVTFVYFPIAHMAWDAERALFSMGALDFAGGTVVHINAGIAALVGAW